MATAIKLVSVFGRKRANQFLRNSLSKHASEKHFAWAISETLDALADTTLRDADEEALDIVPNIGAPPAEDLRKKVPERIRKYDACSGVQVVAKLSRDEVLNSLTRNLRFEDFKIHILTLSDYLRPGVFRFLTVVRSEGGFLSADGKFSYHVMSFRTYGRLDGGEHYMLNGVGYRKDAF